MKIEVGVDSVEICRVAKSLQREGFLRRVYSPAEQERLLREGIPPRTAAGFFAAKEAFAKSIGRGIRGFSLTEVSIENDPLGKPRLVLYGRAKRLAGRRRFDVSITHTKTVATAVVVAYR